MSNVGYLGSGRNLWCQVRVETVGLSAGLGIYQLSLNTDFTFTARPEASEEDWVGPIFLSANVWGGPGDGTTSSFFLGSLVFPEPNFVFHENWPNGFAPKLTPYVELRREQIEAIENMRDGGDLALRLDLHVLVGGRAKPYPYFAQFTHRVSRSEWVKLLDQVKYLRKLLIEIPIPEPSQQPLLAKSLRHLEEALAAMTRGENGRREAVGLCRDAIESLREAFGDKDAEAAAWQKRSDEMEEMETAERLLLVRRALFRLTSEAKHPTEARWSRGDVQSIIGMTAALLQVTLDA